MANASPIEVKAYHLMAELRLKTWPKLLYLVKKMRSSEGIYALFPQIFPGVGVSSGIRRQRDGSSASA